MFQNRLSNAFTSAIRILPLSSLLVLTAVVPSLALPQNLSDSAALSEQPDSQTAGDLGTPLEMNCEIATRMGLIIFYKIVDGEQVPVDCLSLLRLPGDSRPSSAGYNPPNYKGAADHINQTFGNTRDSDSIELPPIYFEF